MNYEKHLNFNKTYYKQVVFFLKDLNNFHNKRGQWQTTLMKTFVYKVRFILYIKMHSVQKCS